MGIDRNILCEVTDLVKTLFNIEGKPKKITIGKVEMKIEKLSLLDKYLNKLPLTKKYLQNNIENVENFQKKI